MKTFYRRKSYLTNLFLKKLQEFGRKARKNKGSITNSKCIDCHSNLRNNVEIFDSKYRIVLDNSESQTNLVPFVPALNKNEITFSVKDVDNDTMQL